MSYTERKERNGSSYYYRVRSRRREGKVKKNRIYLGKDLSDKERERLEREADRELHVLENLLSGSEIEELGMIKSRYSTLPKENWMNRYETFLSRFTHDSTAIEGNTLTLQETAGLLFEGITPRAKHLREINEVINHKKGFDFILAYRGDMSRDLIMKLHELVMEDAIREDLKGQIGRYRDVQVFIRGVEWMPPSPQDVPEDMKELLSWYTRNRHVLHPLVLASYFHMGFETVHPFVDGNGRVGRLLMNFILHSKGYPMVNIPSRRKMEYYSCLEIGQVDGNLRPFIDLMLDLLRSSELMF